jgi:SAM-dependent methyltransferase
MNATAATAQDIGQMPGHWFLARLGKKVLRPGGIELTKQILKALELKRGCAVLEFAPGLGVTTGLIEACDPGSYCGIDLDEKVIENLVSRFPASYRFIHGDISRTPLPDACCDRIVSEAVFTMHGDEAKAAMLREAFRLLKPGGRMALHEIAGEFREPDSLRSAQKDLSREIRVNARPIPESAWRELAEQAGFTLAHHTTAPFALLEPARLLRDEGAFGMLRMAWNLLTLPGALKRFRSMRKHFAGMAPSLRALGMVLQKP